MIKSIKSHEFVSKIKRTFPGLVTIRNRVCNYIAHYLFKNLPAEKVFTTIYKENYWGDAESNFGTGSNIKKTVRTVTIINEAIKKFSVKSILDIPCGDFNWMRNANLNGIDYLGGDIVESLIKQNQQKYTFNTIASKVKPLRDRPALG